TDKSNYESDLKISLYGFLTGNSSVKTELEQKLQNSHTQISFYSSGTVTPLPSLDNVLQITQNFPSEVAKAKGWPIRITVTPYKYVENYPDLNSPANWAMERTLQTLSDLRNTILPVYLDDLEIKTHRNWFSEVDDPAHRASLMEANAALSVIEDAAKACFAQNTCSLPNPLPLVPRHPVAKVEDPATEFLAIMRQFTDCVPGTLGPPEGTDADNCELQRKCLPNGHWGPSEQYCLCHTGQKQMCSCPECGQRTQVCDHNRWLPCSCNSTCPGGFSPDAGYCSIIPDSTKVGYASWAATSTPENSIFRQIPVPAECTDTANYECELEFGIHDKGGSCNRNDVYVAEVKCDDTAMAAYNGAFVGGGALQKLPLPSTGCKNYINFWKLNTDCYDGITCPYGCVRYVENVHIAVRTRKLQCTFTRTSSPVSWPAIRALTIAAPASFAACVGGAQNPPLMLSST
ncbi:hypothetical protein, partial [Haliangium sp. UPWRP_2]|uniref:hypothetical protein n=1 Tax=Haliangium sp. UPWRP_2 TaxID=1931276 RepID=UPI001E30E273